MRRASARNSARNTCMRACPSRTSARIRCTSASCGAALCLAVSVMLSPVLAATPASGLATVADVAQYKGADRQEKLETGAREEGSLMFYTSMDLEESQPIIAAFTKKYPFLKADIYRA